MREAGKTSERTREPTETTTKTIRWAIQMNEWPKWRSHMTKTTGDEKQRYDGDAETTIVVKERWLTRKQWAMITLAMKIDHNDDWYDDNNDDACYDHTDDEAGDNNPNDNDNDNYNNNNGSDNSIKLLQPHPCLRLKQVHTKCAARCRRLIIQSDGQGKQLNPWIRQHLKQTCTKLMGTTTEACTYKRVGIYPFCSTNQISINRANEWRWQYPVPIWPDEAGDMYNTHMLWNINMFECYFDDLTTGNSTTMGSKATSMWTGEQQSHV